MGLQGSISDIIDTLAQRKNKLRLLDLSDNHLNESIADSAEALCQLTHGAMGLSLLNLARNELNGSIPECLLDDSSNLKEFVYGECIFIFSICKNSKCARVLFGFLE